MAPVAAATRRKKEEKTSKAKNSMKERMKKMFAL